MRENSWNFQNSVLSDWLISDFIAKNSIFFGCFLGINSAINPNFFLWNVIFEKIIFSVLSDRNFVFQVATDGWNESFFEHFSKKNLKYFYENILNFEILNECIEIDPVGILTSKFSKITWFNFHFEFSIDHFPWNWNEHFSRMVGPDRILGKM